MMPKRTDIKKVMVIGSGKITGMVDGRTTTKEEVGLLMTKTTAVNEENKQEDGNEGSKE